MKPTHSLFINKHSPNSKGTCSISVRITYNRKKRYYPTGISLSIEDYKKVMGERPRKELKEISMKLKKFEERAKEIIDQISNFSWVKFENKYYTNRGLSNDIEDKYKQIISENKKWDRWGTASNYQCSINSLKAFRSNLKYEDITPDFLREYEKKMLIGGKSKTTVGIYLRPLQAIFNRAINEGLISKDISPFGSKRDGLYEIPISSRTKKAIGKELIKKIFDYKPNNSKESLYRDYWIFMYLCNGMNTKDMCLLKYENIKGNVIEFVRAKSKNTKREETPIIVSLQPEVQQIIKRWGNKNKSPETYIFNHLSKEFTLERMRKVIQQLNKQINTYMRKICKKMEIPTTITVQTARHTFSNILRQSGASTILIRDSLGHGTVKTTEHYLGTITDEEMHKAAKALLDF
jgi:integrase/recombinase XerD